MAAKEHKKRKIKSPDELRDEVCSKLKALKQTSQELFNNSQAGRLLLEKFELQCLELMAWRNHHEEIERLMRYIETWNRARNSAEPGAFNLAVGNAVDKLWPEL